MNVLVTGATGFVGREIIRRLAGSAHRVRILVRHPNSPRTRAFVDEHELEPVRGDILAPASLGGALSGVEAVIHLVGIISEAGQATFENVHVRGTQHLVSAAEAAGVKRFIHMSALGTRPDAISRYHSTKWRAEETVRASKLDWTIFRPSLIYGPEDHFVNLFARMSRFFPILPVMGRRDARFQPVPVGSVAKAFVGALTTPEAVGRTFELCGPQVFTMEEILRCILAATRRKRLLLRIPPGLARTQAAVLEWVFASVLRIPPPLNRDQLLMLQEDNTGDPTPADTVFDLRAGRFLEEISKYL